MWVFHTNDTDIGSVRPCYTEETQQAAADFLNLSPRNAVQILTDEGCEYAVWRGASDELNNFYYQMLPLEEPDAEGWDFTAIEALVDLQG